jgi:twin arginine-targeting protein translocase, TatA/E family
MGIGPTEIIVIVLIAIVLFGAGRIANIGKELGEGIKNFKKGIRDEEPHDKTLLEKAEAKAEAKRKTED